MGREKERLELSELADLTELVQMELSPEYQHTHSIQDPYVTNFGQST